MANRDRLSGLDAAFLDLESDGAQALTPVSYTHLTLPTICSV